MTDDCAATDDDRVKREAREWVMRLTSGAATAADVSALNCWRAASGAHRKAFAEANHLWDVAGVSAIEAVRDGVARPSARPAGGGLRRRSFLGGALAASAAGVGYLAIRPPLQLWPAMSELAADIRTATGKQRQVLTVGGAAIELNTRTSINLAAAAAGEGDRVELVAGEAAVTTAGGASLPLTVIAADGRSTATGAKFNVRYDEADVRVTCLDGTVDVSCGGGTVTLTKRQQIAYGGGRLGGIAEIDPVVVTGWRDGLLVFRNDPLARVIDEVNRYRPGKIIVMNPDLGRKLVFASFRLERLDEVVTRVEKVFGARVRSLPGGIVVLS